MIGSYRRQKGQTWISMILVCTSKFFLCQQLFMSVKVYDLGTDLKNSCTVSFQWPEISVYLRYFWKKKKSETAFYNDVMIKALVKHPQCGSTVNLWKIWSFTYTSSSFTINLQGCPRFLLTALLLWNTEYKGSLMLGMCPVRNICI